MATSLKKYGTSSRLGSHSPHLHRTVLQKWVVRSAICQPQSAIRNPLPRPSASGATRVTPRCWERWDEGLVPPLRLAGRHESPAVRASRRHLSLCRSALERTKRKHQKNTLPTQTKPEPYDPMKTSNYMLAFAGAVCLLGLACSAKAQSGCDGPVHHNASSSGNCACLNPPPNQPVATTPSCGGPVITMNDYYFCGGNTTLTCDTTSQQIGTSTTCIATVNWTAFYLDVAIYQSCLQNNPLWPWVCGSMPTICTYTTCSLNTTGTPIYGDVYSGSSGTCPYAKADNVPTKQQIAFLLSLYRSA